MRPIAVHSGGRELALADLRLPIVPADLVAGEGDWEVEIGFVIGTRAKSVTQAAALSHVAGYFVCNDVSEREDQIERGGQWVKGKSHDTYGPIGPWLVTRDEIPNPQKLNLWCDINGQRIAAEAEGLESHGLKRAVAGEDHQIGPGDFLAILLLDRIAPRETSSTTRPATCCALRFSS